MTVWNAATVALVALATGLSYALTLVARRVAARFGLIDKPDGQRKSHAVPTPLLGGVAVYCAFLVTMVAAWLSKRLWVAGDSESKRMLASLLISGGLYCLVGILDDRTAMRPRTKLLLQIIASFPFVVIGRSIETVELLGMPIELGVFGVLFTIFWLVACTNIINLVDGLDGLAGTIGLIVCLAIAGHSTANGLQAAAVTALIFAGCLVGFLIHNWPPAKIFLGDSGSLLIGFTIGALSIESSLKTATSFAMAIPLVLVSVPVFDTFMAIVRRKLNGRGIGEADRGHIHHCLQDRGLSRVKTLLTIAALCLAMASVTIVSAWMQNDLLALALCLTLLGVLIVGRVFGYNETVLFFHYIRAMSLILADTSGILQTRLFLLRNRSHEPELTQGYWRNFTDRIRDMGGTQLEFTCEDCSRQETLVRLHWKSDEASAASNIANDAQWEFRYSLPAQAGCLISLCALGTGRQRLKGQRLSDLFHLFDTFCRAWSHRWAAAGGPSAAGSTADLLGEADLRASTVDPERDVIPIEEQTLRQPEARAGGDRIPPQQPSRDRRVA